MKELDDILDDNGNDETAVKDKKNVSKNKSNNLYKLDAQSIIHDFD